MTQGHEPYQPPAPPPPGGAAPPPTGGLPWERRSQLGFWPGLRDTVILLVTSPVRGFASAMKRGDYASPLLFAVLVGTVFGIIAQMWGLLFDSAGLPFLARDTGPEAAGLAVLGGGLGLVFSLIFTPIAILVGIFIGSAITHLMLMLLGALQSSTAGFEGTVRASAYSQVATIAGIVPIVGSLVGSIWMIVLYVIGLRELHETTTAKAVLAVLIPLVVCCGLAVVGALVFGAALAAAFAAADGGI